MSADSETQGQGAPSGAPVPHDEMLQEVLEGLEGHPRTLPSKYFYDERGSELFERICELDEYYVTRTEVALLESVAAEIAEKVGPRVAVVEPGSGAEEKIRILLRRLEDPVAYIPFEISEEILESASRELARDFPDLEVLPVLGDFTAALELPHPARTPQRLLLFFPGSTIGNFHPDEARDFLGDSRRVLGAGGMLLVGVDRRKDAAVLERAYDDAAGVTAAFNLNILARLNRDLGCDFAVDRFRHRARYDTALGRVEMRLESLADQTVHVGGRAFRFSRGEVILTEVSYKYDPEGFQALARGAGLEPVGFWTDPGALFSLHLLR